MCKELIQFHSIKMAFDQIQFKLYQFLQFIGIELKLKHNSIKLNLVEYKFN